MAFSFHFCFPAFILGSLCRPNNSSRFLLSKKFLTSLRLQVPGNSNPELRNASEATGCQSHLPCKPGIFTLQHFDFQRSQDPAISPASLWDILSAKPWPRDNRAQSEPRTCAQPCGPPGVTNLSQALQAMGRCITAPPAKSCPQPSRRKMLSARWRWH